MAPHRRPLRLCTHAVVQLGTRFDLSVDRNTGRRLLADLRWCYSYDAGAVWFARLGTDYVFPVSKGEEVVTVLEDIQAFVNCPQAVFAVLVKSGNLKSALALRARMNQKALPHSRAAHPQYDADANKTWASFSWVDALRHP